MKKELFALLEYWEKEKGIERIFLLDSLEKGLQTVYRKKAGLPEDTLVKINPDSGEIKFLSSAGEEIAPPAFPWERIAAQAAKQILIQKIREAEKNAIYQEFTKVQDEILSGRVERFEDGHIILSFGKTEGLLPQHHKLPTDHFRIGEAVRVYLIEVRRPNRGNYQLIVSRTHPDFVRKLLMFEIPELKEGLIEVKSIARFPGDVTKVAVSSRSEKIDPVGTCIGDKALRIKNITKELRGEKIEILKWSEDPEKFVVNSLGPARAEKVMLREADKEAVVLVSDEQLYLAIGKRGQNVRLASKLTGWNIRVFSVSEYQAGPKPAIAVIEGLGGELVKKLAAAGYGSINSLAGATVESLTKIPDMDEAAAADVLEKVQRYLKSMEKERTDENT